MYILGVCIHNHIYMHMSYDTCDLHGLPQWSQPHAADIVAKNIEAGPRKERRSTSKPSVWDATELEYTPWNQGARSTVSCRGGAALHPERKQAKQNSTVRCELFLKEYQRDN